MGISRYLATQLLKTDFVNCAVKENSDLRIFRQRPSGKMLVGLICIALSYILCWPVISALSVFAVYVREPLWVVIGGPAIWLVSHFLCMFGLYLSGVNHTKAFLKWAVRIFVEKHMPGKTLEQDFSPLNKK